MSDVFGVCLATKTDCKDVEIIPSAFVHSGDDECSLQIINLGSVFSLVMTRLVDDIQHAA